jgi:hypothetical protein
VEFAERAGSHHGRITAYLNLGLANVLSGAWHDALEALGEVLATGRKRLLLMWEAVFWRRWRRRIWVSAIAKGLWL